MKFIYTLVALIISNIINADLRIDSLPVKATPPISLVSIKSRNPTNERIIFRCGAETIYRETLLVIDGFIYDYNQMQKLNPNDVASINILKNSAATALYGCRGAGGVIIITTKTASAKKIIIKDFLSGDKVPLATVYFISKNDTIKTAANDNGILVMDKLKPAEQYRMTVSSTGYKTFTTAVRGKEQEILLERDVKECDGIVVIAYSPCICRRISCGFTCIKIKAKEVQLLTNGQTAKSIYPNPVQRYNVFNIEFVSKQDEALQLTILGLNGKQVMLQEQKAVQGLNHLAITADARWSAGIYIVQLRNEKGTIIKREKLIIQ